MKIKRKKKNSSKIPVGYHFPIFSGIFQYGVPYGSHAILQCGNKKNCKKVDDKPAASSAAMYGKIHGNPAADVSVDRKSATNNDDENITLFTATSGMIIKFISN